MPNPSPCKHHAKPLSSSTASKPASCADSCRQPLAPSFASAALKGRCSYVTPSLPLLSFPLLPRALTSPAAALARSVLPVPGGPTNNAPA
eukprot:scaffold130003_cov21-Tisochrysis_lutea.AAC.4